MNTLESQAERIFPALALILQTQDDLKFGLGVATDNSDNLSFENDNSVMEMSFLLKKVQLGIHTGQAYPWQHS